MTPPPSAEQWRRHKLRRARLYRRLRARGFGCGLKPSVIVPAMRRCEAARHRQKVSGFIHGWVEKARKHRHPVARAEQIAQVRRLLALSVEMRAAWRRAGGRLP